MKVLVMFQDVSFYANEGIGLTIARYLATLATEKTIDRTGDGTLIETLYFEEVE